MGRRKNNPDLVDELINRRWDASLEHEEYTEKYNSLSSSDRSKVSDAIDGMEKEFFDGDTGYSDDEDGDEGDED